MAGLIPLYQCSMIHRPWRAHCGGFVSSPVYHSPENTTVFPTCWVKALCVTDDLGKHTFRCIYARFTFNVMGRGSDPGWIDNWSVWLFCCLFTCLFIDLTVHTYSFSCVYSQVYQQTFYVQISLGVRNVLQSIQCTVCFPLRFVFKLLVPSLTLHCILQACLFYLCVTSVGEVGRYVCPKTGG